MQFSVAAAALLAFVSSALAQTTPNFDAMTKPAEGEKVPAGSTYEIVWSSNDEHPGSITLSLLGGTDPAHLETKAVIATGVDQKANKYSWAVDSSLGKDATYGIQITLESNTKIFQYSFPFQITGGSSSGSASSTTGYPMGTVTATISKSTPLTTTSTVHSNTTTSTTTTIVKPSSNYTSTSPPVIVTTTKVVGGGSGPSTTASSTPSVPTSGAMSVAAGSFAALSGLVIAALAL